MRARERYEYIDYPLLKGAREGVHSINPQSVVTQIEVTGKTASSL
jgi:hypothetical protein